MASIDPFSDLARDLPDGAFWVTGKWLKQLFAALTADRVRAGANLDEHPSDKGRFFNAKAGGGTAAAVATPPLTVVDASAADSDGNPHPGRVRVLNGTLGGFLPAEMKIPDIVLPGGADNRCYLTMSGGLNYLYAKLAVNRATGGLADPCHVYRVDSPEDPDGTFLYLLIASVTFTDGVLTIFQQATGNQQVLYYRSRDGSTLFPFWSRT